MQAQVRTLDAAQERYHQSLNRLEALLATYWPGVTDVIDLERLTLWSLAERFVWSGAVAKQEELARRITREVGRGHVAAENVEKILASACVADGLEPTKEEENELRALIRTLRQENKAVDEQRGRRNRSPADCQRALFVRHGGHASPGPWGSLPVHEPVPFVLCGMPSVTGR